MKSFEELRIVFMGTPEFAVASLDALVKEGANIVGVITAPDKLAGRGMQLQSSAVKKYSLDHDLNVLQPDKLKAPQFIEELKLLNADLQIVVAFRMLPEMVWNMPPMGTVNVHASLLPQYRGAAPINWAIINGEKETGVTIFKLKHEIDMGAVLLQEKVLIEEEDNAGSTHDKLMVSGAQLLVKTVKALTENSIEEKPQETMDEKELNHAPKIFKEDCKIDWEKNGAEIQNLIRGLSPYPAAFTSLNDKQIKIYAAHFIKEQPTLAPGGFETDHKTWLRFAANDGWIYVDELHLEGKRKMKIEEFLRGFRS